MENNLKNWLKVILSKNMIKKISVIGLIVLFICVIIPIIQESRFSKVIRLSILSNNINSISFKEEIESIKDRFKINKHLYIENFDVSYDETGEIRYIYITLIEKKLDENIVYGINYNQQGDYKDKLLVSRQKTNGNVDENYMVRADYLFEKIDFIKDKGLNKKYEDNHLIFNGITSRKLDAMQKFIFLDRNNNTKVIIPDDSVVKGIIVNHIGMIIDSKSAGSSSSHGDNESALNYLIEI